MSVSINNFGWRLGNQLFQLAAAITLADENYDEVAFPEWKYALYFNGDFTPKESIVTSTYTEPEFSYNKIPYRRNIAINGYFQSYKYWWNNRNKIRKIFTVKNEFTSNISDSFSGNDTCSVHIRLGDYKNHPDYHPIQPIEYYIQSMKTVESVVGEDVEFFVFSDDKNEARKMFEPYCLNDMNEGFYINFSTDNDIFAYSGLCNTKHSIIGNSSFSLFPTLLKGNGIKIAPKSERWFGPALKHHDLKDLVPDDWIRL